MVTIAASRVWALSTLRCLLWTSHAPIAGGWPSRGCGPGSASCKGAGYLCLCRDLGFPLVAARGVLLRAVARLVSRWQWGIPLQKDRGLFLPPALRYRWGCQGNRPAPPMEGGYRLYRLALPPTIGCRSLHRRVSQTNLEMMVLYRCHPLDGFGSGNCGYACPGRWECWARVEASTVSRTLKVGRLVSRGGSLMSSLERGRHLSLPETAPVACPPSPPLMAERRGGIRRSRRWSDRLRCNCVQGPLPSGAVISCSPPGPVGTRRPWPAVLMWPAEKLLQPYTLWRCLGYVCNPRSLKEETETSRPVATAPVPPLRARAPARLLSENLNMRCTCCLLILTLWSAPAGCNNVHWLV